LKAKIGGDDVDPKCRKCKTQIETVSHLAGVKVSNEKAHNMFTTYVETAHRLLGY